MFLVFPIGALAPNGLRSRLRPCGVFLFFEVFLLGCGGCALFGWLLGGGSGGGGIRVCDAFTCGKCVGITKVRGGA